MSKTKVIIMDLSNDLEIDSPFDYIPMRGDDLNIDGIKYHVVNRVFVVDFNIIRLVCSKKKFQR